MGPGFLQDTVVLHNITKVLRAPEMLRPFNYVSVGPAAPGSIFHVQSWHMDGHVNTKGKRAETKMSRSTRILGETITP